MSAFVPIQYLLSTTTSFTAPSASAITVPNSTLTLLNDLLGPSSNGNFTTARVYDGINFEIMFLLGVDAGAVTVLRAQEGTTAVPLASGASLQFVWTETAILAIAPGGTVTCTGSGGTVVTGGPNYHISSPILNVTPGAGIAVSGSYGSGGWNISSTVPSGPAGPTGPAGPATVVTGTGLASATTISGGYNVDVPAPSFVSGTGINITGSWPNITITNTQTPGGAGTVTSVAAGTGITITGTPTVNPTVSLTATGITPGVYGAITLNAAGQVTAISASFFTGLTTSTTGVTVANPSAGAWTVNIGTASTGTQGLVKLAAATAGGSNNAGDATSAVTPAGVNAVLAALSTNPANFAVTGTQTALSPGTYTNTIMSIGVAVAAGKSALINIYAEVYDSAALTVPQSFGIGLFNGGSLLAGVSQIPSSFRQLQYLVTGPLTATLTVKTTALTGTQTLGSYYATTTGN